MASLGQIEAAAAQILLVGGSVTQDSDLDRLD